MNVVEQIIAYLKNNDNPELNINEYWDNEGDCGGNQDDAYRLGVNVGIQLIVNELKSILNDDQ